MERLIIRDARGNAERAMGTALRWLVENGGGTVASDSKESIQTALGLETGSDVAAYFQPYRESGVKLGYMRRGLPFKGYVVAAFASDGIIRMLDNRPGIKGLLVLEKSDGDTRWWVGRHSPAELPLLPDEAPRG